MGYTKYYIGMCGAKGCGFEPFGLKWGKGFKKLATHSHPFFFWEHLPPSDFQDFTV